MYSSDDQSIDCVDDDDDDDYDVPPAFRLDLSDIARLSSVVETDACPTTDGYDARNTDSQSGGDDDDDYDVPPAFRLDLNDVVRPSSAIETESRTTEDACDANSGDQDDGNYDVLPSTLRPATLEAGCPSPMNHDVDDLYDYLTTKNEAQLASPALTNKEQYDFITANNASESDNAAQRVEKVDPDIDDGLYDYVGTHGDAERQPGEPSFGGDKERVGTDDATACVDELYDYPPFSCSHEATTDEADSGGNCSDADSSVLVPAINKRKQSSSSSSSDDHYDMLPRRSDQLSVRKSPDAFADSAVSTNTPLPTTVPPTSRPTLLSGLQASRQHISCDSEQTVTAYSDVTRCGVVTPAITGQRYCRPVTAANNDQSYESPCMCLNVC